MSYLIPQGDILDAYAQTGRRNLSGYNQDYVAGYNNLAGDVAAQAGYVNNQAGELADHVQNLMAVLDAQEKSIMQYNEQYGNSFAYRYLAKIKEATALMESTTNIQAEFIARAETGEAFSGQWWMTDEQSQQIEQMAGATSEEAIRVTNMVHKNNIKLASVVDELFSIEKDGEVITSKLQKNEPVPNDILSRLAKTASTFTTLLIVGGIVLFGLPLLKKVIPKRSTSTA